MADKEFIVHETAVVDDGAQIGRGTRIWHFSHVMSNAKIGENCNIGQNVYIANNVAVGNNVKIQNNVSIYEGTVLEDYVFCGPSMVFTNIKTPRSAFPRNSNEHFLKTLVRHGATIGANATLVCGITVGRWAFIGAGAVVTKDVPDYSLVTGMPGKVTGWVCECGITLKFDGESAVCTSCDRRYKKSSPESVVRTD